MSDATVTALRAAVAMQGEVAAPAASKPKAKAKAKPKAKAASKPKVKSKAKGPVLQGSHLKSQMLRVDADFAEFVRKEAAKNGLKVTEVTRQIYLAGLLTD